MPDWGHRRTPSYFSEFSAATAHSTLTAEEKQHSEEELDRKVQTLRSLGHRKYNSVTLPLSVKFSVTREPPNIQPKLAVASSMARPRSPQKKHEANHVQMELMLDETLLAIRQKLSLLSSERTKMEHQMDNLTTGIKEAYVQCSKRLTHRTNTTPCSLRRASSHSPQTFKKRVSREEMIDGPSDDSSRRSPKKRVSREEIMDGASSYDSSSSRSTSSINASKESLGGSPLTTASLKSNGLSESLNSVHSSTSKAYRRNSSMSSTLSIPSTSNLEVFTDLDDYMSQTSIPELPESPRLSTPRLGARRFTATPSPIHHTKTESPPHPVESRRKLLSSHRNSLPESVLNQVREDDTMSGCDSLSQLSTCTDDGSPKSGSTLILRRSSLTGQMEHIRRPRVIVKRNSSFTAYNENSLPPLGPLSCSFGNLVDAGQVESRKAHRPLSSSRMKRMRKHQSFILPSIETTV